MIRTIIRHFMEKGKNYKDNPLNLSEEKIYEHILKTLELVEISEVKNPSNIKDKAFTSLGNIKKYPTLFRRASVTHVSAKRFFHYKNWISTKEYLELHYIEQSINDTISEIQKHEAKLLQLNQTNISEEDLEQSHKLQTKLEALTEFFDRKKEEIESR